MNENVDENLKSYAKIMFWICVVAIEIIAFSFLINEDHNNTVLGLTLMFVGPFIIWGNYAIIYAIGEIITQLKKNPRGMQEARKVEITKNSLIDKNHIYYCRNCNKTFSGNHDVSTCCLSCNRETEETEILTDDWRTFDESKKNDMKNSFRNGQYLL